jgi:hypothetical protein
MSRILLLLPLLAALAACGVSKSTAAGEAEPEKGERQIDWSAAQKDAAAKGVETAGAGLQPNTINPAAKAGSSVPILAPPPVVGAAGANLTQQGVVQATPDGYFAMFEGSTYDVVIHGTKDFYAAPPGAPAATKSRLSGYRFDIGEGQAQLAFTRYGADYLVEFNCKTPNPLVACVTEAEAVAFAERLQAAGR